jgi:hypothetical protein
MTLGTWLSRLRRRLFPGRRAPDWVDELDAQQRARLTHNLRELVHSKAAIDERLNEAAPLR